MSDQKVTAVITATVQVHLTFASAAAANEWVQNHTVFDLLGKTGVDIDGPYIHHFKGERQC